MPVGKRPRVEINQADENRLLRALDRWAATGDFVALRTRAFVLLLWDGAVRTSVALALNAEEVIEDLGTETLTVVKTVVQRSCEANRFRGRKFPLSARTQKALAEYLRLVRAEGWLPGRRMRGPLFLATVHRGQGQRLSVRSASHAFEVFQLAHVTNLSQHYQLEDVVFTGRLAFMRAAAGRSDLLSSHTGISRRWAAEYQDDSELTAEDVITKLDKSR